MRTFFFLRHLRQFLFSLSAFPLSSNFCTSSCFFFLVLFFSSCFPYSSFPASLSLSLLFILLFLFLFSFSLFLYTSFSSFLFFFLLFLTFPHPPAPPSPLSTSASPRPPNGARCVESSGNLREGPRDSATQIASGDGN